MFRRNTFKKNGCRRAMLAIVLSAGIAGCGGGRAPVDVIATADTALNRAIDSKASDFDPLDLRVAREELDQAKQLMAKKEYDEARRQGEKAAVDAQLAEAKARAANAKKTAKDAQDTIDALRKETEQKSTGE